VTATVHPTHGSTGPARTATWQDALELVRLLLATGAPHGTVELPGLHLSFSTGPDSTVSPSTGPAATSPGADEGQAPEPGNDCALRQIVAPVIGTFYRRPAPTQPPFVEVGDEVGPETVVGIVEVMKLMVPVEAGVSGRIARVCAEDATAVEEGQALFEVTPDE
jgi:acetyl-CoA carboxylase biotin carboxyl carrier protein